MIRIICTISIFFICINCFCQNLISNHSFEDTINANYWTTSMGVCLNSPVVICSNKTNSQNIEKILFNSFDGNSCAYLSLFQCHTGWSDYLINTHVKIDKGKRYELSFYITPSDSCGYYSKVIDVLFCNKQEFSKNLSCSTPGKIFLTPTVSFDISSFRQSGQEGKWMKLSYTFVANDVGDMLVIGRFFTKKKVRKIISTRILNYKPSKQFMVENFCSADYYLDNFSLIEK